MAHPSRSLSVQETHSLLCTLAVISVVTAYLCYLKQEEWAQKAVCTIVEYEDVLAPPLERLTRSIRRRDQPWRSGGLAEIHAAQDATMKETTTADSLSGTREGMPFAGAIGVNTLSPNADLASRLSSRAPSPMFRTIERSTFFDSIVEMDRPMRQVLLREHLNYSSAVYDTVQTLHLMHLSNMFRRFDDKPVSLEESMQQNLRRYGFPYNPNRPQPPSAQVPLEGIVFHLLGLVF